MQSSYNFRTKGIYMTVTYIRHAVNISQNREKNVCTEKNDKTNRKAEVSIR